MSSQTQTSVDLALSARPVLSWPGRAFALALAGALALHLSLLTPGWSEYAQSKHLPTPAPAIAVQLQAPLIEPLVIATPKAASVDAAAPATSTQPVSAMPVKAKASKPRAQAALVQAEDLAQPSQYSLPDFNETPAIASTSPAPSVSETSTATGSDLLAGELPFYPAAVLDNAQLKMTIQRQEPGKNPVYGEGIISYSKNSDKLYQIELRASLSLLFASINLYQLSSQGQVVSGQIGFQPALMNEKRRNRAETATHFDAAAHRVSFSSSNKTMATSAQVQDKASFLLQLSAIARANPDFIQAGQKIHLQVAEERDMSVFSFEVIGQETLQTKAGNLICWHLRRPAKPGAYNSVLEIWLAPEQQWLPVQIQNTEANGAVTTQTVTELKIGSTN